MGGANRCREPGRTALLRGGGAAAPSPGADPRQQRGGGKSVAQWATRLRRQHGAPDAVVRGVMHFA